MNFRILSWMLTITILLLSACVGSSGERTEKTTTFQLGIESFETVVLSSQAEYGVDQQREVVKMVTEMVNGGDFNIVSITTEYEGGHLMGAKVTYIPNEVGDGNKLRVMLLTSDEFYYSEAVKDVAAQRGEYDKQKHFLVNEIKVHTGGEDVVIALEYYSWTDQ